jgi:hypothetical protein
MDNKERMNSLLKKISTCVRWKVAASSWKCKFGGGTQFPYNFDLGPSWWGHMEQGVCHNVALPFTLKSILRQKEELWKLKYFTMQKYNLQKKSSKRNQKSFKILLIITL